MFAEYHRGFKIIPDLTDDFGHYTHSWPTVRRYFHFRRYLGNSVYSEGDGKNYTYNGPAMTWPSSSTSKYGYRYTDSTLQVLYLDMVSNKEAVKWIMRETSPIADVIERKMTKSAPYYSAGEYFVVLALRHQTIWKDDKKWIRIPRVGVNVAIIHKDSAIVWDNYTMEVWCNDKCVYNYKSDGYRPESLLNGNLRLTLGGDEIVMNLSGQLIARK